MTPISLPHYQSSRNNSISRNQTSPVLPEPTIVPPQNPSSTKTHTLTMCHQYLCADCAKVSWDFCTEASDFNSCPNFSQTTYQTDRRCHPCIVMTGVIEELGYWLARHPKRDADYDGPESDEDSISVKSFTDSDDEETDKKVVAKPDSPWGCQSGTTLDEEDAEAYIHNKGKENIAPVESDAGDEDDEGYDNHETDDEEDMHSEIGENASAAICMGW